MIIIFSCITGILSLNLKLANPLSETTRIIMYSSYSDALKFDGSTVSCNTSLG